MSAACKAVLLLWLIVLAGVAAAEEPPADIVFDRDTVIVETATGHYPFDVELALTPEQQARGLMFRRTLSPDAGMLFDFGRTRPVSMWMRNTYVSLDMVFIFDNGVVHRIERATTPLSERIVASGEPVRYVLEVVAGTTDRIGLRPGDRLVLPAPR